MIAPAPGGIPLQWTESIAGCGCAIGIAAFAVEAGPRLA
jgi:hypothetical protein